MHILNKHLVKAWDLSCIFLERLSRPLLKFFRLQGARIIGMDKSGNYIVILNRKSDLGKKGEKIFVAYDDVLIFNVTNYGAYEKKTVSFFKKVASLLDTEYVFVDIGANCGLLSVAVSKSIENIQRIIAIEPVRQNIDALRKNFTFLNQELLILEVGLGAIAKSTKIHIPISQFGSATLRTDYFDLEMRTQEVLLRTPEWLFVNYLDTHRRYLVKCDIEGSDLEVLNSFPEAFWEKVDALSFEMDKNLVNNEVDFWSLLKKLENRGLTLSGWDLENVGDGYASSLLSDAKLPKFTNTNVFFTRNHL